MYLPSYLALLTGAEQTLAASYQKVATGHAAAADVNYTCAAFARQCAAHANALANFADSYPASPIPDADRLQPAGLDTVRSGPLGMLRDLADLYQLANLVEITWQLIGQAASGARDRPLIDLVAGCESEITAQLAWLRMRMKAEAPQVLLVTD